MTPNDVVAALAAGEMERIRSAASHEFRAKISGDEMTKVWGRAVTRFGPFRSSSPPLELHDVPLDFERGKGHLQIAYRSGEIVGLILRPGEPNARFGE